MKVKSSFLIVALFLFPQLSLLAQNDNPNEFIPQVIAPSPNAAALGKYGEIPVSYYTGIPNISIPLYQVEDQDLTLPISLSYHASGIKVEELASWVGLGWSLSAGGVITRSTRGLPDDTHNRGYTKEALPTTPPLANNEPVDTGNPYLVYATGHADGEPDMFYFNFAGRSGKFVFDRTEGALEIRTIPHQKIDIKYEVPSNGNQNAYWTIRTEDGTIYTFAEREITGITTTTDLAMGSDYTRTSFDNINSWYLTKIESPRSRAVVSLQYTPDGQADQVIYDLPGTETKYLFLHTTREVKRIRRNVVDSKSNMNFFTLSPKRLEKITFSQGSIEFTANASQRCDIEGDRFLQNIIIKNVTGAEIKRYEFNYKYLNQHQLVDVNTSCDFTYNPKDRLKYRLMLTSLQEKSGSAGKPPYYFEYDLNLPGLPSRFSAAQDHWGYFNGQTSNTTLSPHLVYRNPYEEPNRPRYHKGGNRTPSLPHTRMGTLIKITYPTGGYTSFSYELNQAQTNLPYYNVGGGNKNFTIDPELVHLGVEEGVGDIFHINDEIAGGSFVKFSAINFPGTGEGSYDLPFWFFVHKVDEQGNIIGTNPVLSINSSSFLSNWKETLNADPGNKYFEQFLENGRYKVTHQTLGAYHQKISDWYYHLNNDLDYAYPFTFPLLPPYQSQMVRDIISYKLQVSWMQASDDPDKFIGGLRIKSIIDFDAHGVVAKEKYFSYLNQENQSSGTITSIPEYTHPYFEGMDSGDECLPGSPCVVDPYINYYLVLSSQPQYPLGTTSGSYVGYSDVTVSYGKQGENGKTHYRYTTPGDFPDLYEGVNLQQSGIPFPFAPVDNRDWQRGLLLSVVDLNAAGKQVRKVVNQYKHYDETGEPNFRKVKGVKAGIIGRYDYLSSEWEKPFHLNVDFFYSSSGYTELEKAIETLYDQEDPTKFLIKETTFQYSPTHLQLLRSEEKSSKGEVMASELKYPSDIGNTLLTSQHIHNVPLEQYVYRSGGLLAKTLTQYKEITVGTDAQGNPIKKVAPEKTDHYTSGNTGKRTYLYGYDAFGNLNSKQKEKDLKTAYLWGYDHQLPVAEVANALPGEIFSESFEENGVAPSGFTALTGDKVHSSGSYSISFTPPVSSSSYLLSYWYWDGSQWNYREQAYTGPTTITDGNSLDEIRIFPQGAMMATYTYDLLRGITSVCDPNSVVTYYHYDDLGRLQWFKDYQGQLLKKYEYHYQNQP